MHYVLIRDNLLLYNIGSAKKNAEIFKHLQLRNKDTCDDVGTCSVIVNSNIFPNRSCMHIPSVVNGQQLWSHVQHNQYSVYHTAKNTGHFVVCKIYTSNMNLVFSLWWGHHYKQFIPRPVGKLCSFTAQWQQQSYSPTGRCPCSFCSHCPLNFPGQWVGQGGPIVWPPCSPDLTPLDFFLWGCVKDQVYSWRVTTLNELKAWVHCSSFRCYKGHVIGCQARGGL
jgi:hypothetical protein